MHLHKSIIVFISIVLVSNATEFLKCSGNTDRSADPIAVSVSKCPKSNCILRRNTRPQINIKFKPNRDITSVKHQVQANILQVPLPFPGVDGTDACPNIYAEDGITHLGCPLENGKTYVYSNSFEILPFYPTVSLTVHYGLTDGKNNVACFEVPARIK